MDLAAVAVLVPSEVVNAGARYQSRVSVVFCVFHTRTVLCALFDLIDPEVVDSTAAGVVELP